MNPVLIDNHINSACCITPTLLAYSSPHQCLTGSGESLFYANPCQLRSCGNREHPLIGQIHPGLAVRTELVRVDPANTLSVLFQVNSLDKFLAASVLHVKLKDSVGLYVSATAM